MERVYVHLGGRILRTLRSAARTPRRAWLEYHHRGTSITTGEFVEANGDHVRALRETDKRIHSGWPNEVLR